MSRVKTGMQRTISSATAFAPESWLAKWRAGPLSVMNRLPCCTVCRYLQDLRLGST